jgi:hypothetical protein
MNMTQSKTLLAAAAVLAVTTGLPAVNAFADEGERATLGEWIALAVIVGALLTVVVIAPFLWRRNTNPHTGLPSKIKTRRFRGPLTRIKP